jgi:hypothetical protein
MAFPQLIVHHHLGLGDHIICNGMVHWLNANMADEIWLPAYAHNFESVQRMYSMTKNVKVISLETAGAGMVHESVSIANLSTQFSVPMLKVSQSGNDYPFDRRFYESLGIDFSVSYDWFTPVPEDDKMQELHDQVTRGMTKYCLVHDEASIGRQNLKIHSEFPQIRVEKIPGFTIMDWTKTIMGASEIHCIDSSILHLVERLDLGIPLTFHDIGRPSKISLRKPWNKVLY